MTKNITIEDLRNHKKKKTKFACLTAYDASLSRLMSEAGIELILVGDSLGMVVQGHDSTIPVSMEDLLYHLRCVKRGNVKSHIMADMPFMSYATENLAYDNAMRLMQAGANSVKVILDGEGIMQKIEISDETLKENKSVLEDLITAAHNNAKSKLREKTNEEISKTAGGFGIPGFKWPL